MPSIGEVLDLFKQATLPMLNDLKEFLSPFAAVLPDRRYGQSVLQFVPGMLAAQSPQVSQAAAHAPEREASSWSLAKCIYRLLDTPSKPAMRSSMASPVSRARKLQRSVFCTSDASIGWSKRACITVGMSPSMSMPRA